MTMLTKRHTLCNWMAHAAEPYQLHWDVIERHLEPDQYQWFFQQPLHRVQLVLVNETRDDCRWVTLVAEFFDLELEQQYNKLWTK